jgi:hypothetical protein
MRQGLLFPERLAYLLLLGEPSSDELAACGGARTPLAPDLECLELACGGKPVRRLIGDVEYLGGLVERDYPIFPSGLLILAFGYLSLPSSPMATTLHGRSGSRGETARIEEEVPRFGKKGPRRGRS